MILLRFYAVFLKILNEKSPLLGRLKDKMRRKINEAKNIGDNEKFELLQRLEGIMSKNCVCHGDYNPSNVIIPVGTLAKNILEKSMNLTS